MQSLLLIAYPLCLHFAIVTASPRAQLFALVVLAAGISYQGLKQRSVFAGLVLLSVILISWVIDYFALTLYVLYVPPIVIPLLLWSGFYRSLLPGQVPLTTQIGESVHGTFSPEMSAYSRKVTQCWSVFFIFLALWALVLTLFAPLEIWSLFTNVINYVLVGLIFLIEFLYRKWRFRDFNHMAFWHYVYVIAKTEIRKL